MQQHTELSQATIPAAYTQSKFYVSAKSSMELVLSPGLLDLAATPYHLIMQE